MKRSLFFVFIALCAWWPNASHAQGVAQPLAIQGLDRFVVSGARHRAMGGSSIAIGNDATALFSNPAAMARLANLEFRLSGSYALSRYEQRQEWIPNRLYAELSLIFENDAAVVTRPFDNLKPNWQKEKAAARPALFAGALPFEISNFKIIAGLGFAEMINLDHYFQNNNALNPNIGQMRPAPIPRLLDGDSLRVNWFQFNRQREGSLYGITPALALGIGPHFSLGASVTFLTGSSDDRERRHDRGLLTLRYNNDFSLAPANYQQSKIGTSDYKGTLIDLGIFFQQDYFSAGAVVRPSMHITRDWARTVRTATATETLAASESGSDRLDLPANYLFGLALYPTGKWRLAIDYERRELSSATYETAVVAASKPWLDGNIFRFGVEYQALPWLALRGGFREEAQVFAPEGDGLINDPARGSVYTFGAGLKRGMISIDAAYEYARLSYEDRWLSNINYNRTAKHTLVLETGIEF